MKLITKIACRTLGTAGMGIALYDAVNVGAQYSKNGAQKENSKYLEKAYSNARTVDTVSYSNKAIQEKVFDLRTQNPLPAFWGQVKGGTEGFFHSLGTNIIPITSAALALVGKGLLAKAGAVGVTLSVLWNVLRSGFGAGKQTPMD